MTFIPQASNRRDWGQRKKSEDVFTQPLLFREIMKLYRPLALALSVSALTACGGGGDSNSGMPAPPPPSNTTPTPAPTPAPDPSSSPAPSPSTGGAIGACQSFKEANATTTTRVDNTATSSVSNAGNVIDGDRTTSATLVVNGSTSVTQGVAIRATAQSGIVFASGKMAGAFYSVPPGMAQSYTVLIRTLLGGSIQESNTSDNSGGGSGVSGGHGSSFNGIMTTKPFDAVEVVVSNTQAEASPKFEVFEICSDHAQ